MKASAAKRTVPMFEGEDPCQALKARVAARKRRTKIASCRRYLAYTALAWLQGVMSLNDVKVAARALHEAMK